MMHALFTFSIETPVDCVNFLEDGKSNRIILACGGSFQSANCSFDDGRPPIVPCKCHEYFS